MTTKTDDINLPPLPVGFFKHHIAGFDGPVYAEMQMEAYARVAAEPYAEALRDLIEDLELRSNLKRGRDHGTVDCGQGVYERAKRALGELDG